MARGSATVSVRDATMSLLRSYGMNFIFGNPGSTELPMFRDLPADIRYILCLQESVAMAMADGYAQATRNAAFVNLHSAAGLGHSLGNLFTAYKNQTPLVVTAGQQARSMLLRDPFLFAQDAIEFPKPYVKWACEPARAEDVPAAIARAYHIAMTPPCGPTFVSIPVDDWDRACDPIEARQPTRPPHADPASLAVMAQALAAAKRPALVVGAGIARGDAWNEAIALAELQNTEVFVAPFAARCSFPEDHPLFKGFLPPAQEGIVQALVPYDVVLVVGGALSLYHTEGTGPHAPSGTALYHIVDDPTLAAWAPNGTAVVGAVKPALVALLRGPAPEASRVVTSREAPAALDGSQLNDAYLMQQISAFRPAGAVIVEEAPSSRTAMHERLPIIVRDGFYTCASGGLGHGLPAALGVALGRPDAKIIAVLGDGSSMYAIQGLWTAAQLGLPISFVIVNNGRYEALAQFGRHFNLDREVGIALPDIDFCGLAMAQGVSATRVTSVAALDTALTESFAATGPTLVEVIVE